MLKYVAHALSLALLAAAPAAAMAQSDQRPGQNREEARQQSREQQTRSNQQQPRRQGQGDRQASPQPYGEWSNSWGSRPPAPPAHWTRKSNWYAHVRACKQRFRSYNPATNSYRAGGGKTRRCAL